MSDAATSLSDLDPAAWARGVVERHVAIEEQLAQAGLRLALAIEQDATQAVADKRPVDKDAAMAFSRTARAVRLSGLLQARLIKDMQEAQYRAEAAQLAEAKRVLAAYDAAADKAEDEDEPQDPLSRHQFRVGRVLERQVRARHPNDEDAVDRLMDEALDRLDDEDLYGDVLNRPIGELVSLLCRDLDVHPDWDRMADEAWAQAEIASGVAGSPFNTLDAVRAPPFAAANGGEDPLADPGEKPGEERVGVGESHRNTPAGTGADGQTHADADHYP